MAFRYLLLFFLTANAHALEIPPDLHSVHRIMGECISNTCEDIIYIKEIYSCNPSSHIFFNEYSCKVLISIIPLKGWENERLEDELLNFKSNKDSNIYESLWITSDFIQTVILETKDSIKVHQLENTNMKDLRARWEEKVRTQDQAEYKQQDDDRNKKYHYLYLKVWTPIIIFALSILYTIKRFFSILIKEQSLKGLIYPIFIQILIFGGSLFLAFVSYAFILVIALSISILWCVELITFLVVYFRDRSNKDEESQRKA